jgi:peptidoglycan lytic transglycosylase
VKLVLVVCVVALVASCQRPPPANPRYVLGAPYEAGGVWYYPRESYEGEQTGLATVYAREHQPLTADGEVFDQSALAAAHQTLQLPAIARLTNLENGRQVTVRINDRGPATPHRLLEVTRRTATLLQFAQEDGVRVRLDIVPAESHAAADAVPGVPKLNLTAAPVIAVRQSELPPPGSMAQPIAMREPIVSEEQKLVAAPIERLPETVTQVAANPGRLFIQLGTFQSYRYAEMQRAKVAALGAGIASDPRGRRQSNHRVVIGPLASVEQADKVLDQVLRAGVTDAHIVVE